MIIYKKTCLRSSKTKVLSFYFSTYNCRSFCSAPCMCASKSRDFCWAAPQKLCMRRQNASNQVTSYCEFGISRENLGTLSPQVLCVVKPDHIRHFTSRPRDNGFFRLYEMRLWCSWSLNGIGFSYRWIYFFHRRRQGRCFPRHKEQVR